MPEQVYLAPQRILQKKKLGIQLLINPKTGQGKITNVGRWKYVLKKWALNQATKGLGGPLVSRVDLWMMTLLPSSIPVPTGSANLFQLQHSGFSWK
jgi:hypothetical protein